MEPSRNKPQPTHRPKAVHVKVLLFRPVQPHADTPLLLKTRFSNAPISKKIQKNFSKRKRIRYRNSTLYNSAKLDPMPRRTARGQLLPPTEVEYLNSLPKDLQIQRVHDLYQAGWSLESIGSALSPTRPRTTMRTWVQKGSLAERKTLDAPIPTPSYKTPAEGYQKQRPDSPGIQPKDQDQIKQLAPLARTYRAKMASTSAAAVANERLTELCKKLHDEGVSIRELAETAEVTYRAMYKRVVLN